MTDTPTDTPAHAPFKSAYSVIQERKQIERHTFSVLVDNVSGVLARVVGMFSARGYNLESLTVAAVDKELNMSRINIVTTGNRKTILQIKSQISRIVAVRKVVDVTEDEHIEREVVLIKVHATGTQRREALRLAEVFHAEVVDATLDTFMFQIVGSNRRVMQFIGLMRDMGTVEVARSGVVAMTCGSDILSV